MQTNTIFTLSLSNSVYQGQTFQKQPHGFGVLYWKIGQVYIGGFEKGYLSNFGIVIQQNGNILIGQFYNNKLEKEAILYQHLQQRFLYIYCKQGRVIRQKQVTPHNKVKFEQKVKDSIASMIGNSQFPLQIQIYKENILLTINNHQVDPLEMFTTVFFTNSIKISLSKIYSRNIYQNFKIDEGLYEGDSLKKGYICDLGNKTKNHYEYVQDHCLLDGIEIEHEQMVSQILNDGDILNLQYINAKELYNYKLISPHIIYFQEEKFDQYQQQPEQCQSFYQTFLSLLAIIGVDFNQYLIDNFFRESDNEANQIRTSSKQEMKQSIANLQNQINRMENQQSSLEDQQDEPVYDNDKDSDLQKQKVTEQNSKKDKKIWNLKYFIESNLKHDDIMKVLTKSSLKKTQENQEMIQYNQKIKKIQQFFISQNMIQDVKKEDVNYNDLMSQHIEEFSQKEMEDKSRKKIESSVVKSRIFEIG